MTYDPRQVTQSEQELIEKLTREIVIPEVMEPMEKINWNAGEPPAPNYEKPADNPQATQQTQEVQKPEAAKVTDNPEKSTPAEPIPVTTTEDTIDWESFKDPVSGLYGSKYKSKAEAIKGMGHVVTMAKDALTRAALLEKENTELRSRQVMPQYPQQVAPIETKPRQSIVESKKLDEVLAKIVEDGGTIDESMMGAFKEAINEQSKAIAASIVEDTLAAREQKAAAIDATWNKVRAYMATTHPESLNFVDEMGLYVIANPKLQTMTQKLMDAGEHILATELAWTEFDRARSTGIAKVQQAADERKTIALEAGEQARKEAVAQARVDAGVMTTIAGGVHESENIGPSSDEVAASIAEMNRTGDGSKWRALTFGRDLANSPYFR